MSVENITPTKEFEQKLPFETERKFVPIFPEQLEVFRPQARPIEQFYLSHPSEDFSLRLRETFNSDGALRYQATLKSAGKIDEGGLKRLEVESEQLSQELYNFYRSDDTPIIRKLRAEPLPGVTIDFFEDGQVRVESEDDWSWLQFTAEHGDQFVEITGDHFADNEWLAHLSFRRANDGHEALKPVQDISVDDIVSEVLKKRSEQPVILHIAGRSGSGKSTIVRKLQEQLHQHEISSTVLSTDDYHRGASALECYNNGQPWQNWDDPFVYDTATMATCIGRRLLRDLKERPQFTDPTTSLTYMLEQAEPMYRAQAALAEN